MGFIVSGTGSMTVRTPLVLQPTPLPPGHTINSVDD
jgi:hypothetical protein